MRRLIPPSPVRLTSEDVLEYSTSLVHEYLTFLAHSGTHWQTCDVWRVLLSAATQGATIEAVCSDWNTGPDANTIRQVLRECLTNDQFEALETAINTALTARLPHWLARLPLDLALDLHEEPYYGRAAAEAEFICRGEAQKGTTRFYRCATAYVLARGWRLTLAVRFLRKADHLPEVVRALRHQVQRLALRIRRLYLDKGFCSVEILQDLQAERVSAILAVTLTANGGVRTLCRGRKSYRTGHTFRNPQHGAATVPVCVVRSHQRSRRGNGRAPWLIFVALRCRAEPSVIRDLYRRRFGIESGYRLMEQLRIHTTSTCSAWRFLFMGLALILVSVWNLLQWAYTSQRVRGQRRLQEGSLRLHRFVRFVVQAVDRRYGLRVALPAITSIGKY